MNNHNGGDKTGEAPAHSRVLVFDDNDVDRFAVCHTLQQSGIAAIVQDTGSAAEALEQIKGTKFDCLFVGDSIAQTHLFSLLLALNQVGYHGRVVIVAYGVDHAAARTAAAIDVLSITWLTPERLAASCRQP